VISMGALPSSHLSYQKATFFPFLSFISVEAWKRALSCSSHGRVNPYHGFESSAQ
jgi:hypothetical protein